MTFRDKLAAVSIAIFFAIGLSDLCAGSSIHHSNLVSTSEQLLFDTLLGNDTEPIEEPSKLPKLKNGGLSEHRLYKRLLKSYVRELRPSKEKDRPIVISIDPELYQIIEINEQRGTMAVWLWLRMKWRDDFLTWSPDEYDGLKFIKVPVNALWTPDITIRNTNQIHYAQTMDRSYAAVRHTGVVTVELSRLDRVGCAFSINKFPFDTQQCVLHFLSWSFPAHMVKLKSMGRPHDLANYQQNDEWILKGYLGRAVSVNYSLVSEGSDYKSQNVEYSELHYKITLTRIPSFYLFVIVVPTFLITTLSLIGLFTPFSSSGERQERVSLGLMTLLSMSVILHVVSRELPKSPGGLPLLGKYVMYEFTMATMGTVVSVLLIFAHQRILLRGWAPPSFCCASLINALRHVELKNDTRKRRETKYQLVPTEDEDEETTEEKSPDLMIVMRQLVQVNHYLKETRDYIDELMDSKRQDDAFTKGWNQLFSTVDLALMIAFPVLNLLITVYIFSPVFQAETLLCETCLKP